MYYNTSTLHDDIIGHEKTSSDVEKSVTVKMEQQLNVSQTSDSSLLEDEEDDEGLDECICSGDIGKLMRRLFINQATDPAKCYRYTGLSREKLDLVFGFVKEKAKHLRYWRGSIETPLLKLLKGVMSQDY